MDDPHFDHRSAKRFDRQRASGPFGVDEILPKKIAAWVSRKHPDTHKPQTLLNFTEWQRGQAARILQDFELHVYEWTLTAVKFRQSLDKQDKRDVAQSVFAQDRDQRLLTHMVFVRAQTLEREQDDEETAEQTAGHLSGSLSAWSNRYSRRGRRRRRRNGSRCHHDRSGDDADGV